MMAHPMFVNADYFNSIAMDAYKIEFFGKPAHAAGAPHKGLNALDAMINFFNLINAMRQETKPEVLAAVKEEFSHVNDAPAR